MIRQQRDWFWRPLHEIGLLLIGRSTFPITALIGLEGEVLPIFNWTLAKLLDEDCYASSLTLIPEASQFARPAGRDWA